MLTITFIALLFLLHIGNIYKLLYSKENKIIGLILSCSWCIIYFTVAKIHHWYNILYILNLPLFIISFHYVDQIKLKLKGNHLNLLRRNNSILTSIDLLFYIINSVLIFSFVLMN